MKHRVLKFVDTEEAREVFALIYQGFITGGNGPQSKGMEIIRREAAVLDKLESVSEEQPDGRRLLSEGEQYVALTVPEYELVKRYFQSTPWNTKIARKIRDIDDWLSAVPLEESDGR